MVYIIRQDLHGASYSVHVFMTWVRVSVPPHAQYVTIFTPTNLKLDSARREGLDPHSMKTLIGVILNIDIRVSTTITIN